MCEDKKLTDNQAEMSLAFEILPEEIWEKIFKYLKRTPSDLVTCMNTCGQWYNLLKSERTTVMFPEVFKILADSKEVNWMLESKRRCDEDDAKQPLTKTRLLSCRLVSKAWNDAILSFIQWHPSHFQLDEWTGAGNDLNPLGQQRWQRDLHHWSNRPLLEQFSKSFGASHVNKNPFVTRSLTIADFYIRQQGIDDPQIVFGLVTRLLKMFGEHLWHFHVDVSAGLTSSTYYALLQSWLTLMPNLKTLRIYYTEVLNDDDDNQIEASPFPMLKNLRVLELDSVPPPLCLGLLQSCRHSLARLRVEGSIVNPFRKPFSTLPRMKRLKMASITLDDELELLALEKAFLAQQCSNLWPLKSLYFGYNQPQLLQPDCEVFDFSPSWDSLFRFVNLFKDTLTNLRLDLPKVYHDSEKRRIYRQSSRLCLNLQLPKLKTLRVVLWNRATFDFLLPLKKLEELEIWKPGKKAPVPPMAILKMKILKSGRKILIQKKPSEVIKSHGWIMGRMSDSNIWQRLPRLRVLKIETKGPKKIFGCLIRQLYRVVKRDKNGRAEVVPKVMFVL